MRLNIHFWIVVQMLADGSMIVVNDVMQHEIEARALYDQLQPTSRVTKVFICLVDKDGIEAVMSKSWNNT